MSTLRSVYFALVTLAAACSGETYTLGANDPCLAPRVACPRAGYEGRSICIDPQRDPAHCGGCNVRCGEGRTCLGGLCCGASLCDRCYGDRFDDHRIELGAETTRTLFADLDHDGFDDVITAQLADESMTVVWGHRDGEPDDVRVWPIDRPAYYLIDVADVDSDGHLDVSFSRESFGPVPGTDRVDIRRDGVLVRFGDGRRGFQRTWRYDTPWSEATGDARWVDVDGDGDRDLLARSPGIACTSVRLNRAGRGAVPELGEARCLEPLERETAAPILFWLESPSDGAAVRFLEHDRPTDSTSPLVRVTLDATGTRVVRREPLSLRLPERGFVCAYGPDVNRDGRADLVLGQHASGSSVPRRVTLRFATLNGDGDYSICGVFEFVGYLDPQGATLADAIGDFNGDGLLDIAGAPACGYCPSGLHISLRR